MPFFLGSFIASFLFTSSLLVELSTPSSAHIDTKQQAAMQATVAHVSPLPIADEPTIAEATVSSQVYGPFTLEKESPSVSITPTYIARKPNNFIETLTPTTVQSKQPQTPTPTPAHTMFVSAATLPSDTPSPTPSTSPNTLNADLIFSLVNQHRTSMGLPAFEQDATTCSIAASRAPQVYNEIYVTHTMHAGLHRENYPYFINENIISMNSEQAAVNWWLNDTIHREAIEGNYKYSCVACSGHSCSEIFTSYVPK